MELPADEMAPVINRIKRARGQLDGILRMLEEGRSCEEIVTQLAAVSKALDRAGFAVIASGPFPGVEGVEVAGVEVAGEPATSALPGRRDTREVPNVPAECDWRGGRGEPGHRWLPAGNMAP